MSRVPRIRFKGFEEDWEQRKLEEIAERIVRKNEKLESTLPLTISAQYGLIDQNEFFDKRIASKDVRGYYLIKKGEFAYNKSTSVDAPLGAIKRLDKYKNGVLSTLYILFKIIDDTSTSSDYLVTYYSTNLWHKEIQLIAAEGARNHGLLNIAPNDFFETMISIPLNVSEQKKIGNFFISLDHLITLHQSKFFEDILKTIASYTLYWEQRKLEETFIYLRNNTLSREELNDEDGFAQSIHYGDVLIKYGECLNVSKELLPYIDNKNIVNKFKKFYIQNGDVIIADTAEDETVGKCIEISGIVDHNIISGLHTIPLRPVNNFAHGYLGFYLNSNSYHNQLKPLMQGIKVTSISKNLLKITTLNYPSNIKEQKIIGSYFDSLNHLITLHQLEPFQLIFKAIAYRIIDYAKSKPPMWIKYEDII